MSRELLQQALDAPEAAPMSYRAPATITALRSALAAPMPEQSDMVPLMAVLREVRHALAPVSEYGRPGTRDVDQARLQHVVAMIDRAIAAAPAPVVPLTDQEIANLGPGEVTVWAYEDMFHFARAVERAHGIGGGEQPAVLPPMEDPDCHYIAPKGKVCNKCGRIHRGIGGGGK